MDTLTANTAAEADVASRSVQTFGHIDVLDASAMVLNMKRGINDLPTEIPSLLNVLDNVARIHPSISGRFYGFNRKLPEF